LLPHNELSAYFKKKEIFSHILVKSKYFFVRCDGRNFRKLSRDLNLSPFDLRFRETFIRTVIDFLALSGFKIGLVFYCSDEVNFLVVDKPFNGRVEKIDSVFSSLTSSIFTLNLFEMFDKRVPVSFDARIIPIEGIDDVINYLVWRQLDCFRNFLNKMAQLVLSSKGYSPKEVAMKLLHIKGKKLVEIIEKNKGPLESYPKWQRHGDIIYRVEVIKKGYNPLTNEKVTVLRRRIIRDSFDFDKEREKLREILEKNLGNI